MNTELFGIIASFVLDAGNRHTAGQIPGKNVCRRKGMDRFYETR
jgi:hypothetical protein